MIPVHCVLTRTSFAHLMSAAERSCKVFIVCPCLPMMSPQTMLGMMRFTCRGVAHRVCRFRTLCCPGWVMTRHESHV